MVAACTQVEGRKKKSGVHALTDEEESEPEELPVQPSFGRHGIHHIDAHNLNELQTIELTFPQAGELQLKWPEWYWGLPLSCSSLETSRSEFWVGNKVVESNIFCGLFN